MSHATPGPRPPCLLIPLAPDLEDSEETRERYFHIVVEGPEAHVGNSVRDRLALIVGEVAASQILRDPES